VHTTTTTYDLTARVTLYRNDRDELLGTVTSFPTDGGRRYYVAEVRDYDGDAAPGKYLGLCAGVFDAEDSAVAAVIERARTYGAL